MAPLIKRFLWVCSLKTRCFPFTNWHK